MASGGFNIHPLCKAASSSLESYCVRLVISEGDVGDVVRLMMKGQHILLAALAFLRLAKTG